MISAWRSSVAALLPLVAAVRTGVPPTGSTQHQLIHVGKRLNSKKSVLQPIVARPPSPSKDNGVWGTCMRIGQRPPEIIAAVERGDDVDVDDNGSSLSIGNGSVGGVGGVGSLFDSSNAGVSRWWQRRRFRTILPLVLSATTAYSQASIAAVTGGRIGGGYTPPAAERTPSAPPMQQEQRYQAPQRQQQYQPRAGRDIYGSDGSRFHITFDGGRMGRRSTRVRFDPDAGDVPSSTITAGDVAMVGGVSAAVAAVQRYNRKRFLEEEGQDYGRRRSPTLPGRADRKGSKQTAVVSTLQLSLWCDRTGGLGDVLATLDNLSQTADVNSPRGLSTLINEVCLTLLRSDRDWIGGTGSLKTYSPDGRPNNRDRKSTPASRAKRDFNRAAMRERSKWERETVSNTPDRGFSSSTAPSWGGSNARRGGTYAVATLMVAWAGLRSTPPKAEPRKGAWFWQDGANRNDDDRDVGYSVVNRQSALTLLQWLADEAAEGRGENVLDVEVLWTPADPDDSLDRDDLDAKWPELRAL